jgi:hypothetical protein
LDASAGKLDASLNKLFTAPSYSISNTDVSSWNDKHFVFGVNIDGGGSSISLGTKGYRKVPFGGKITNWEVLCSSGNITIDLLRADYDDFPNTISITNSNPPFVFGNSKNESTNPNFNWINDGDLIEFKVTSVQNVTKAWLMITLNPSVY